MRTVLIIAITIICTWFVTSGASIEFKTAPVPTPTPAPPSVLAGPIPQPETKPFEPPEVVEIPPPEIENIDHYIFDLINQERVADGKPELQWSEHLYKMSQEHSNWMLRNRALEHSEYNVWENIFEGILYPSEKSAAEATFQSWMTSPPHRANILNPSARTGAVSLIREGAVTYTTFMAN